MSKSDYMGIKWKFCEYSGKLHNVLEGWGNIGRGSSLCMPKERTVSLFSIEISLNDPLSHGPENGSEVLPR